MAVQTVIIGPGYLLGQSAAKAFDPLLLISLRTAVAALLMAPVFFLMGGWTRFTPTRAQWRGLVGLALIGVVVNSSLFVIGLRYTTPANSALIYALSPALVLLLAVLVFKDEKISGVKALGVAIAFSGVLMLFLGQGKGFEGDLVLGNVLTLAAVILWALFMVLSRRLLPGLSPIQVPAVIMAIGALLMLPLGLWKLSTDGWPTVSPEAWVGIAYLTLINSVFSFFVIQFSLSRLRASQVAIYMNLQPLSAFAFSWLLGRDQLTMALVLGATLTIGGIFILNWAQQRIAHVHEGASE
jgi:drug/metabolite transporter (DMT)-like permease